MSVRGRLRAWGARKTRIWIAKTIEAPKDVVWLELSSIDRHVIWMLDAVAIDFTTDQRRGVGTSFRCRTKVGPFRTTDQMTITSWIDGREIGVEHRGLVRGTGRFTLRGEMGRTCVLRWEERLTFPIWLGGPVTAMVAKPILKSIWIRNLDRLAELIRRGMA